MHKKCWLSTIDRLAGGEPTASAELHHDHQSVDITEELTASTALHHGHQSVVGTADAEDSADLDLGHQLVVGTTDAETQEAGDSGADLMLTTEVRWLWNKDTTMVRLKKNGPTTIKRI
jgi:hypothetical protein